MKHGSVWSGHGEGGHVQRISKGGHDEGKTGQEKDACTVIEQGNTQRSYSDAAKTNLLLEPCNVSLPLPQTTKVSNNMLTVHSYYCKVTAKQ